MDLAVPVAMAAAYLVGSLDFAVVVARARGLDIYDVGSGNPGTSNVLRTMGKGAAAMTLLGDVLKGVIAAAMGFLVAGKPEPRPVASSPSWATVIPCFITSKAGKGSRRQQGCCCGSSLGRRSF